MQEQPHPDMRTRASLPALPALNQRQRDPDRREGRQCGTCVLCCKLLHVVELDKPPGEWCPWLHKKRTRGCSKYTKRPEACREFACLWLKGFFDYKLDRPDMCGVVWSVNEPPPGKVQMMLAYEIHDGATDRGRGYDVTMSLLRQDVPVMAMWPGRQRLWLPPSMDEDAVGIDLKGTEVKS